MAKFSSSKLINGVPHFTCECCGGSGKQKMTVTTIGTTEEDSVVTYDSSCMWCKDGWASISQRDELFSYNESWCKCLPEDAVEVIHGDENDVWVTCGNCGKFIQV